MAQGPILIEVGIVGSTPIFADVTTLGAAVKVTMLADYEMACPYAFPYRASFIGGPASDFPQTLPVGTTFSFFACEANALIAVDAAVPAL
jgi:hypothetical protein